jgi:hypothetical protein
MASRKSNEVPHGTVTIKQGDETLTLSCIFESVIPSYGHTLDPERLPGGTVSLTCRVIEASKKAAKKKGR